MMLIGGTFIICPSFRFKDFLEIAAIAELSSRVISVRSKFVVVYSFG
jgi:hypothetical protein